MNLHVAKERKIKWDTKALALYTHTHTHTHTCNSLKEEKRVDEICSKSVMQKCKYALKKVYVKIAFIINLIFKVSRLLFSKQNELLLKDNFLYIKKVQIKIKNFFNKVKIQKYVFEEVIISKLHQLVY